MRDSTAEERDLMGQFIPILASSPSPTVTSVVLAKLLGTSIGGFYENQHQDRVAEQLFDVTREAMRKMREAVPSLVAMHTALRAAGLSDEDIARLFKPHGGQRG
ncbi:hypothetical protein VQH23_20900 [Pararoseomonas sp. SCSIO 73927]|uniref:hypothetical protein n=1 Tax=Pararoseomonas sp. SCSIO 73927 TaxID=3114537 RepID=UPI0030D346E7